MKTQPTKKLVFLTLVSTVFAISILCASPTHVAAQDNSSPPSVMLAVTARAYRDVVVLTISHYGGDDLNILDLVVQASDNNGTMENATLAPASGTFSVGGTITATYTYGPSPTGKAITVYIIHVPSKQKLFSSSSVLVQAGSPLTNLSISPENFTLSSGYSGQVQSLTATLRDSNNNPIPNKRITWSATAGTVSPSSGTTDDLGQVSVYYTAPAVTVNTQQVTITASFAGDNQYESSRGYSYGTITVENRVSTIIFISPSSFTIQSGQSMTLTATLYRTTTDNTPLGGKNITWSAIYGNVSPSSGVTDNLGRVTVTYTAPTTAINLLDNIWTTFAGDNQYKSSFGYSFGTITAPPSGMNWIQATANAGWSARLGHTSVVFNNKMWVIGGYGGLKNDVWYSSDGVNWIQATANAGWSARFGHTSVVFDNKMWVIGGCISTFPFYKNDVWYSSDGVNWIQATANAGWSARYCHTSVVFNGKMWVIGGYSTSSGYKNDAWYSSDGVNWTQAPNAGWSGRYGHTSVVFNNKMWVIGGYSTSSGYKNDAWYSSDGVNWIQATANAGWSARYCHTSVVFNGKMWVIGGYNDNSGFKNDVWYSSDGVNWTQATASAGWSIRDYHTSVVFNDKMWVIGGSSGGACKNDVWYSGTTMPATYLSISPSSFTIPGGSSITLTATLKDSANNPLAGKVISWSANGGTVSPTSGTTNSYGQVSVTYTAQDVIIAIYPPPTFCITASFAGDSQYQSSTGYSYGTITAENRVSTIITISPSSFTIQSGQSRTLTAILYKTTDNAPLGGKTITWEAGLGNISPSSGVTNNLGRVTVTYTAPTTTTEKRDNIWATFAGDNQYQASVGNSTGIISPAVAELVGYWNFNEGSGTTVRDNSGHGNNGTIYGATWAGGIVGNALSFDGTDDYLDVSISNPVLPLGNRPHTIEAWVMPVRNDGSRGVVYYGNIYGGMYSGAVRWLYSDWDGDKGVSCGYYGGEVATYHFPPSNSWQYLVWTYDGITNKLYVNGNMRGTSTYTANTQSSTTLRIGRAINGAIQYFNGIIDEVKIYNGALSAEEILANYQAIAGDNENVKPKISTNLIAAPSTFNLSPGEMTVLTATLTSNGNPLVGKTITWSATSGVVSSTISYTNSLGRATATYYGPNYYEDNQVAIIATFAGDDQYLPSSASILGTVGARLQAVVEIKPDTLQIGNEGTWVTCYIELPTDNVEQIDVSSILLNGIIRADNATQAEVGDHDNDGAPDLMVKFDRASVEMIVVPGPAILTVSGRVGPAIFIGTDRIDVIGSGVAALTSVWYTVSAGLSETREEVYNTDLNISTVVGDNKVTVIVDSEVSAGATIAINVDNNVVSLSSLNDLVVLVDNREIRQADDYSDIIDTTGENESEYLILFGAEGIQVLVSIPHFSTHTIDVGNAAAFAQPLQEETVPVAALLAVVGVVMALVLAAAFVGHRYSVGDATSELIEHGLSNMKIQEVDMFRKIRSRKEFTIPELMRQTGASMTVTWRTVQKLIKKGLVEPTKKTIAPAAGRGKPSTVYKYVSD